MTASPKQALIRCFHNGPSQVHYVLVAKEQ